MGGIFHSKGAFMDHRLDKREVQCGLQVCTFVLVGPRWSNVRAHHAQVARATYEFRPTYLYLQISTRRKWRTCITVRGIVDCPDVNQATVVILFENRSL